MAALTEVDLLTIRGAFPVLCRVKDGHLTAASYVAAARRSAIEVVDWSGPLRGPALAVLRAVHVVGDGGVDLVLGGATTLACIT